MTSPIQNKHVEMNTKIIRTAESLDQGIGT